MTTGAQLRTVADALAALPARALADAAPAVADTARTVGARVAPRGIAGRRLGADVVVRGQGAGARLSVAASPPGPWRIVNDGSRRHAIGAPGRVLAGGLRHPVAEQVAHPGHRGRHVWNDVARAGAQAAHDALESGLRGVLARGR